MNQISCSFVQCEACFPVSSHCGHYVFLSGRRGSAERPCDWDLDQDCDLCRQSKQHQHQPGQVRSTNTWNRHLMRWCYRANVHTKGSFILCVCVCVCVLHNADGSVALLKNKCGLPHTQTCLTVGLLLLQYKVYSGSGERGHHRFHARIRTTGCQGQERTLVCGKSAKSSSLFQREYFGFPFSFDFSAQTDRTDEPMFMLITVSCAF